MEIILWYLLIGCFVMSVYFILNNSIFVTITVPGFISGIFLWPCVIFVAIGNFLKRKIDGD